MFFIHRGNAMAKNKEKGVIQEVLQAAGVTINGDKPYDIQRSTTINSTSAVLAAAFWVSANPIWTGGGTVTRWTSSSKE